jgi:predicted dehydrogenase
VKLLVVGAGSIGARHVANAAPLGETAVVDLDAARAARAAAPVGATVFERLDDALAWRPDGVVVATPHETHDAIARRCLPLGRPILVEKPLTPRAAEAAALAADADAAGVPLFTVCNMRFHIGPSTLKRTLSALGPVRFARLHYGNYLPNMRPGADYRTLYCARRATGGGVIRDAIHEIDYACWLFGPVAAVTCVADRLSTLDIDVEDFACLILTHASGTRSEIELDYLRPFKRRGCEIVAADGAALWESEGKGPERASVRRYQAATAQWETLAEDAAVEPNAAYRKMLHGFAAVCRAGPDHADARDLLRADDAVHVVRIAECALQAAENRQTVEVSR